MGEILSEPTYRRIGCRIARKSAAAIVIAGIALSMSPAAAVAQDVPTWSLQYEGKIVPRGKDYHIVDLFDVKDSEIATLKADGTKPIAYLSGHYENWRSDAGQFPSSDLGNSLGSWAGERWVNTNSTAIRNIMLARLDLAKARGFAGVDVDNVDFYYGSTGFDNSQSAAVSYIRFLADAAHARGLQFGLKNAVELIPQVSDVIDYYINEEAHEYGEEDEYKNVGKPVFNIEFKWLEKGSPWMYTIYKQDAEMDEREVVVPNGAAQNGGGGTGEAAPPEPVDIWTEYFALASTSYSDYYAQGQPMLASGMYHYYMGLGNYEYYAASGFHGGAIWHYYYGFGLLYYYASLESGDLSAANYYYFYHLAYAYYYYWASLGDWDLAFETYSAYMGYAGG